MTFFIFRSVCISPSARSELQRREHRRRLLGRSSSLCADSDVCGYNRKNRRYCTNRKEGTVIIVVARSFQGEILFIHSFVCFKKDFGSEGDNKLFTLKFVIV